MPKKKLTYRFVDAATTEGKDRIEYRDEIETGLVFRITKTGTKTFSYRYSYKGTDKRYTLGEYPALKLQDARKKAQKLRAIVDDGKDPQYQKLIEKKKDTPPTVEELAERFIKQHVSQLRPATQNSYTHRINKKIVPEFGKFRIEDLTRRMILNYLEEMVFEDGQDVNANRVRAIFSSMLSFGMDKDIIDHNIVKTIKPVGRETARERLYSSDEIRALWLSFEEMREPVQSLFKMLLLTGQRKSETQSMRWDQIEGDVWKIPSQSTKGDRTHYVPLNEMAMELLEGVKPLTGGSEWVFESFYHPGSHLKNVHGSVETIQELSGVEDFRIHDLRRTAASNMARLGTDRTVLGKLLNHKGLSGDSAITAVYDRYEYMKEKRIALAKWERSLQEIITGEPTTNIIKMGV
jgi:integrase